MEERDVIFQYKDEAKEAHCAEEAAETVDAHDPAPDQSTESQQIEHHMLGYLQVQPDVGVQDAIYAQGIEIGGQHFLLTGEGDGEIIVVVNDGISPDQSGTPFPQNALLGPNTVILDAGALKEQAFSNPAESDENGQPINAENFSCIEAVPSMDGRFSHTVLIQGDQLIELKGNPSEFDPQSSFWAVGENKSEENGTEMLFIPDASVLSNPLASTLLLSTNSKSKDRNLMQLACIAHELQSVDLSSEVPLQSVQNAEENCSSDTNKPPVLDQVPQIDQDLSNNSNTVTEYPQDKKSDDDKANLDDAMNCADFKNIADLSSEKSYSSNKCATQNEELPFSVNEGETTGVENSNEIIHINKEPVSIDNAQNIQLDETAEVNCKLPSELSPHVEVPLSNDSSIVPSKNCFGNEANGSDFHLVEEKSNLSVGNHLDLSDHQCEKTVLQQLGQVMEQRESPKGMHCGESSKENIIEENTELVEDHNTEIIKERHSPDACAEADSTISDKVQDISSVHYIDRYESKLKEPAEKSLMTPESSHALSVPCIKRKAVADEADTIVQKRRKTENMPENVEIKDNFNEVADASHNLSDAADESVSNSKAGSPVHEQETCFEPTLDRKENEDDATTQVGVSPTSVSKSVETSEDTEEKCLENNGGNHNDSLSMERVDKSIETDNLIEDISKPVSAKNQQEISVQTCDESGILETNVEPVMQPPKITYSRQKKVASGIDEYADTGHCSISYSETDCSVDDDAILSTGRDISSDQPTVDSHDSFSGHETSPEMEVLSLGKINENDTLDKNKNKATENSSKESKQQQKSRKSLRKKNKTERGSSLSAALNKEASDSSDEDIVLEKKYGRNKTSKLVPSKEFIRSYNQRKEVERKRLLIEANVLKKDHNSKQHNKSAAKAKLHNAADPSDEYNFTDSEDFPVMGNCNFGRPSNLGKCRGRPLGSRNKIVNNSETWDKFLNSDPSKLKSKTYITRLKQRLKRNQTKSGNPELPCPVSSPVVSTQIKVSNKEVRKTSSREAKKSKKFLSVHYIEQPSDSSKKKPPAALYNCTICYYATDRIQNFILHTKTCLAANVTYSYEDITDMDKRQRIRGELSTDPGPCSSSSSKQK